jgi:hypothetical protein
MGWRRILLAAPRERMPDLDALVETWHAVGVRVRWLPFDEQVPDLHARIGAGDDLDAALLVGPPRRAPATVLRAPFALDRRGRRVPLAWLPATGALPLRRFAAAAARVHRRGGHESAVALLGQWHPRYLHLVDRMSTLVQQRMHTFRWTSDAITRESLVQAMGSGLGLAVYVGHGRPVGWVGYHGMRSHHFDRFDGEPLGAVMSLCCRTASRYRTGLSYAEALPLRGVAAACLGATRNTLHTNNTRWAVALCDALVAGVSTVGELVVRSAPGSAEAVAPYRLIGDPLAPLAAPREAVAQAAAVPVYP